jgi:hypothetical protein
MDSIGDMMEEWRFFSWFFEISISCEDDSTYEKKDLHFPKVQSRVNSSNSTNSNNEEIHRTIDLLYSNLAG